MHTIDRIYLSSTAHRDHGGPETDQFAVLFVKTHVNLVCLSRPYPVCPRDVGELGQEWTWDEGQSCPLPTQVYY